jgi:hypothetical protein
MTATNTLSVSVGDTVHVPMAGCDGRVVRFDGSMVVVQLASKQPGAHDHFHFGALEVVPQKSHAESGVLLDAPGYQSLARVLARAFRHAAHGKGKERHARQDGVPFESQPMVTINAMLGTQDGFIYQAIKKAVESKGLPRERAVAELLGAINYLAGAVIAMERAETQANG